MLGLAFRQSRGPALWRRRPPTSSIRRSPGWCARACVETQSDPRSPERGQYRFLQALVREVAYSTLARKDRRTQAPRCRCPPRDRGEESPRRSPGSSPSTCSTRLRPRRPDRPGARQPWPRATGPCWSRPPSARESLGSPQRGAAAVPRRARSSTRRAARARPTLGTGLPAPPTAPDSPRQAEELAALAVERCRLLRPTRRDRRGPGPSGSAGAQTALGRLRGRADRPSADGTHPLAAVSQGRRVTAGSACWRSAPYAADSLGDRTTQQESVLTRQAAIADDLQDAGRSWCGPLNGLGNPAVDDLGIPTAYRALLERCGSDRPREGRILLRRSAARWATCPPPPTGPTSRPGALVAAEAVEVSRQVGDSLLHRDRPDQRRVHVVPARRVGPAGRRAERGLEGREPSPTAVACAMTLFAVLPGAGHRASRGRSCEELPDPYEERRPCDRARAYSAPTRAPRDERGRRRCAVAARSILADAGFDDFAMLWASGRRAPARGRRRRRRESRLVRLGRSRCCAVDPGHSRCHEFPGCAALVAAARGEDPEADLRAAESAPTCVRRAVPPGADAARARPAGCVGPGPRSARRPACWPLAREAFVDAPRHPVGRGGRRARAAVYGCRGRAIVSLEVEHRRS